MTDKHIIIDGVYVSGCKYWKGYCRIASLCDYAGHLCEVTPNCYYKKLKAKEQECERLKNENYELTEEVSIDRTLFAEIDQLKAENKELKKLVDDLLHKPEIQDKILWKIDNETLLGSKDAYIYKLEQTLTEIKNKLTVHKTLYYESKLIEKLHKEILQKISEVEDES